MFLFIHLFLTVLGLCCYVWAFSSCRNPGRLFVVLCRPLIECLQQLWCMGLVILRHVGSSWTRDRTRVPCMGRMIPSHWTTMEVWKHILSSCLFKFLCLHDIRWSSHLSWFWSGVLCGSVPMQSTCGSGFGGKAGSEASMAHVLALGVLTAAVFVWGRARARFRCDLRLLLTVITLWSAWCPEGLSTKKVQTQSEGRELLYLVGMYRTLKPGDGISVALRKLLQGGWRGSQAIYPFATSGAGSLNLRDQVSGSGI